MHTRVPAPHIHTRAQTQNSRPLTFICASVGSMTVPRSNLTRSCLTACCSMTLRAPDLSFMACITVFLQRRSTSLPDPSIFLSRTQSRGPMVLVGCGPLRGRPRVPGGVEGRGVRAVSSYFFGGDREKLTHHINRHHRCISAHYPAELQVARVAESAC